MAFPLPRHLSPSRIVAWDRCRLQFRYKVIDHLPDEQGEAAVLGLIVHAALEALVALDPAKRTMGAADALVLVAWDDDEDVLRGRSELGLDAAAEAAMLARAREIVDRYFELEDPTRVLAEAVEERIEVPVGGGLLLGIIDRLDRRDGGLVVVDYKTGRVPKPRYADEAKSGVRLYALLVAEALGELPTGVELLYVTHAERLTERVSEATVETQRRRLTRIWEQLADACDAEAFEPRTSPLCPHCPYQEHCPARGGTLLDYVPGTRSGPAGAANVVGTTS
jgi:putative RecB family exonuclease